MTKKRVIEYLELKGMPKTVFFKRTGISRGFLDSDKLSQAVSDKQLRAILSVFPDINLEWLVTGEGSMEKQPLPQFPPDMVTLEKYEQKVEECVRLKIEIERYRSSSKEK